MKVIAVIPARFGSTRFPGKPLALLAGKPIIQRVWELASNAKYIDNVIVATDNEQIKDIISGCGGTAVMTSEHCASGTDRVREVMEAYPADVYINIQGDEPLLHSDDVARLAKYMREARDASVATLYAPVTAEQARDPHLVKVVLSSSGNALYFSRLPIPYQAGPEAEFYGHIGVYAYTAEALHKFSEFPVSSLEASEKLEQLRILQADCKIQCLKASKMTIGIDTPLDLENAERILEGKQRTPWDKIRLILTDVDGVLTDGGLWYGPQGESFKRFNARDGQAVRLARDAGIEVGVISGRDSSALRSRLADLGIANYVLGTGDKGQACRQLFDKTGISGENTIFLGDDIPDLEAFKHCAFGVAVGDAAPGLRDSAFWVTKAKGGEGALRELVDMIVTRRSDYSDTN